MIDPSDILWAATSSNVKTGNVPTAWVGLTKAACRESCRGCPMAPRDVGGDGSCYSHSGSPAIAHASIRKAAASGKDRSLTAALRNAARSARMVRLSAIGDMGRMAREHADAIVDTIKTAGLAVVGYTHHWREEAPREAWRGRLMASVGGLAEADEALAAGWRAAAVVPEDHPARSVTPGGATVVVCPAQVAEARAAKRDRYDYNGGNAAVGRSVTCNDCRLCDASRPGPVIAFREHGNGVKARDKAAAAPAPVWDWDAVYSADE
jgi:NAD-dependent dihydropyrimidine dehydrogenase PreA subunit